MYVMFFIVGKHYSKQVDIFRYSSIRICNIEVLYHSICIIGLSPMESCIVGHVCRTGVTISASCCGNNDASIQVLSNGKNLH